MKIYKNYFFALLCCVSILFGFGFNINFNIDNISATFAENENENQNPIENIITGLSGTWGEEGKFDDNFKTSILNNIGASFNISTPDQLATLSHLVKIDNGLSGYNFTITTDLDMKESIWSGLNSQKTTFKGNITINSGITIKNLVYKTEENSYLYIAITKTSSELITRPAITGNWTSFANDANGSPITSLPGSGTKTYPYEIRTASELAYVSKLSLQGDWFLETYFEIRDNIDLSGHIWQKLDAKANPFFGKILFDSKNFEDSNNKEKYEIFNTFVQDTFQINETKTNVIHKIENSTETKLNIVDSTYFSDDKYKSNVHSYEQHKNNAKFVEEIKKYNNGKFGTTANPVEISSLEQLIFFKAVINKEVAIKTETKPVDPEDESNLISTEYVEILGEEIKMLEEGLKFATANYKLNDNIDLAGSMWQPIGSKENPFSGNFDGNGYQISNVLLFDDGPETDEIETNYSNLGFFGYTVDAKISKLSVNNIQIRVASYSSKNTSKKFSIGALVGFAQGTKISYCKVEGSIAVLTFANVEIGGLVGNSMATEINDSYTLVTITLTQTSDSPTSNVGGLVGSLTNGMLVSSYSEKTIKITKKVSDSKINASGIVGFVSGTQTQIFNCFTVSNLSTEGNSTNVSLGGIIGRVIDNQSLSPNGNNINYCYFLSNNQVSTNVTNAVGTSVTLYPYKLVKMTSAPNSITFFENDEAESKWSSLYEWDMQELWSFNELTYLPTLQLFSDYTISLYSEDAEKYELFFLDEEGRKIEDIFAKNYRIGEEVKIVAEFKDVPDGDVGLHFGKYYTFKTWKHAGENLATSIKYYQKDYKTEETDESEYRRVVLTINSFSNSRKGLYSIQMDAKQVRIHVVLEGEGSYEYDTETVQNTNKDTTVIRTFYSTFSSNIRLKAVRLSDRGNWTFNKWYYASNQETDYSNLSEVASFELYSRTTLNIKIGQPQTEITPSPDVIIGTKNMEIDDEGNGFDEGTLNIIIKCTFTSKVAKLNCAVDGNGDFKLIDMSSEDSESGIYDVTKETPIQGIESAVGKKVKLIAVAREGYIFKGWFVNEKEISNELEYIYTLTDTIDPTGVVLNIKAVFVDDTSTSAPISLVWILIGVFGGITFVAIVVIVIIIVVKKKKEKRSFKSQI